MLHQLALLPLFQEAQPQPAFPASLFDSRQPTQTEPIFVGTEGVAGIWRVEGWEGQWSGLECGVWTRVGLVLEAKGYVGYSGLVLQDRCQTDRGLGTTGRSGSRPSS